MYILKQKTVVEKKKTSERCREENEKSILKAFKEIIQYLLLLPLVWLDSWTFSLFIKKKKRLTKNLTTQTIENLEQFFI